MRQGKGGLKVWVAVILGLGLWAPGALAFWPPCQQVTAWLEGTAPNQTVRYKVWDTKKVAYVEGSWTPPQPMDISSPTMVRGLVFWQTTVSSSDFRVYCRVYDPGRSSWQGDEWISTKFPSLLGSGDGVITWFVSAGDGTSKCILRTYDPGPGVWKGGELVFTGTYFVSITRHEGVVAWLLREYPEGENKNVAHVIFALYDPSRFDWRTGEALIDMGAEFQWPSLLIDQATVVFGNNYRFGYDPASGTWTPGSYTQPLSWFVAQPIVGKAPLWVWFTDMTIGGLTWPRSWTFGDGGSSILPSPSHTYVNTGKFTVTQQVIAPWITSSSSQEIRVTATGPTSTPALDLLLLK